MLNTERIRLMAKLAAYEQGEGKEAMQIGQYYRGDYVSVQMIKTFLCSTLAFIILLALSVLYQMEELGEVLYQINFADYGAGLLIKYVLFVVFYQVVAWAVYNLRYHSAAKKQKLYHSRLKKVEKFYEREEKLIPVDNWKD
ncbi:MAG: hypothetical protein HFI76_00225 [Lachnospiraceae bacterium]|jgi:hypothetical protein|nr:hypothetical protein [Lachnospiraceae bacterium]